MDHVTLKFPVFRSSGNGRPDCWYLENTDLRGHTYKDTPSARRRLRDEVREQVEDALTHRRAYETRVLMCGDGTVLLVRHRYGWGYEIYGPDRNGSSFTAIDGDFREALARARGHAEQAFGGVTWECS